MSKSQVVNELHRDVRRHFRRRKTEMRGIADTIQADLVEMIPHASQNRNMKYILTAIDIFSKMAYARPVKNKTGVEVAKALKSIFDEINRPIKNLHVDMGKEFYNVTVTQLLDRYKIKRYSTYSTKKAAIVERFNRTLKKMMWKRFSLQGTYKWLGLLDELIDQYNNTKHRTIKMIPIDVSDLDEQRLLNTVYNYKINVPQKIRFNVGDYVRLSKYKHVFEKGYTPNWTTEIFRIRKILYTDPIAYLLVDFEGKEIEGGVYAEELQLVKHPDVYLVEKILKRRNNQVFVKWLGFDSKFNSWIDKNDVL